MGTISHTDILFATVRRMGRTIYNMRLTGYDSIEAVVRDVRAGIQGTGGLATLCLRNGSQGWSVNGCLNLGRSNSLL